MAKTQQALAPAADAADATPDVVKLKCDKLGVKSRDFTPAHAKALQEFQQAKGLSDWQPADADAPAE